MEFLRIAARRKSLLSEVVYIGLNVALAALLLVVVLSTNTPWPAIGLVLLSKWRIFAVRPRYWQVHLQSNAVDVIVGVGVALLMYVAGQSSEGHTLITQIGLALLYLAWLLFLKPRSKRSLVSIQAGVAVLVGTMAATSVAYDWPSSVFVLVMWIIGYSSARHVLTAYEDDNVELLSLFWGFLFAQLGWVLFHLVIVYTLPFSTSIAIPELSIILVGLSFVVERFYASYHKHEGVVKSADVLMPSVFVGAVIFVLLVFFSSTSIGSV